jgi:GT2 family glycosyltransferase
MPQLSIIFVNWNSTSYLLKCIESIYKYTNETEFEIIVVDNASPDDDVELVKHQFRDIVLIESPENLGFARANNLGFRASSGEYVVFLNPDTILINPAFDLLLHQVRSLSNLGVVGCTLFNEDRTIQTSAIQTFPTVLNQLLDVDFIRNRFPTCPLWNIAPLLRGGNVPSKVEVVSGACLLLRREVFAQVGQFSEDYFMYAEDVDLCYKVVKANFTNYYVPQAQIIHYGGKSSVKTRAVLMKWRSILHYLAKHHGHVYQLAFRMAMACSAMLRLAVLSLRWLVSGGPRKESVQGTLLKWWLILKTMMANSEPAESRGNFAAQGAKGQ